ncbi:Rab8 family GTPase [Phytophthora palmivora]|uniref:Rab8 family GTPase n=1 Tax=Phytophthora palmivora TaxID=4796 RepID=A0A2P4XG18_9STRA|nr:Rab8 family GTPase [Phytophthora palmivora]
MSTVTAPMQHELSPEQAEAEAQRAWEREMELAVQGRGRTRSRSILADDEARDGDDVEASEDATKRSRARCFSSREAGESEDSGDRSRRRSCSFSALEPPKRMIESEEDAAKRAASLSKIYLAGSAPVDVSKLQDDSKIVGVKKVEVVQPTGALSAAALDALSEGLQLSVDNSPMPPTGYGEQLTEEELEEKKMEEEEDHKLKAEKLSARRSLSVRASLFRNKMFKSTSRLLGNSEEGMKMETARNGHKPTTGAEKLTTEMNTENVPVPPKKKHKLKLLLLGDSGVGKTSLMRVFSGDEFSESMLATAGVDFKLRHINVADEAITLQIWDTAGQERFHRITATYYKGANGIVLVYDVSDRRSFDNVGYWMNNIRQYSSPTQMPAMLLVGNKIDLPNRVVTLEEGQAAASQYDCRFIETSAKTSENTNGALETIARDAFLISVNQDGNGPGENAGWSTQQGKLRDSVDRTQFSPLTVLQARTTISRLKTTLSEHQQQRLYKHVDSPSHSAVMKEAAAT